MQLVMIVEGQEEVPQNGNVDDAIDDNVVTTVESSTEDQIAVAAAAAEQGHEEDEEAKQKKKMKLVAADAPWSERMWEVFSTFWPLGFIAFGGPQVRCWSKK
jgi:hypothetical protein